MHECIDEVNAIILTYYRLPENLKEKLDAYVEVGNQEYYKKGTLCKVDKAEEFDFTHKSIESLNKYIKEQELDTFFYKEAFQFYKELAIFLIQEKVRSNDIYINYTW